MEEPVSKLKLQQYVQKGSFYEAVVEDGSDIIFIVDFDGKICYHNTSYIKHLAYRSKSLTEGTSSITSSRTLLMI